MGLSLVYTNPNTVIALLNNAAEQIARSCPETPRLDAEVLLASALNTEKVGLYRALYDIVPVLARERLQRLVARRITSEPISYILGRKEFWSLTFSVSPAVMVPRPDTEVLIEVVLQSFPTEGSPRIIDIGTGSGAIAITLAKELPNASITATDISADALKVAQRNAAANNVSTVTFLQGDLFEPVREQRHAFDLIVSNPPYIPTAQISSLPPGLRDYEPRLSFDGGPDGLEFYRRITQEAPLYLKPGAWLMLEVGHDQSNPVRIIISGTKAFFSLETVLDVSGIERVVKARLK